MLLLTHARRMNEVKKNSVQKYHRKIHNSFDDGIGDFRDLLVIITLFSVQRKDVSLREAEKLYDDEYLRYFSSRLIKTMLYLSSRIITLAAT